MPGRLIIAKFSGKCRTCSAPIEADKTKVWYVQGVKGVQCASCSKTSPTPAPPRERPGADKRSLPVDVLAREISGRAISLAKGRPCPDDTPEAVLRDLALVLVDYELVLRNRPLHTSADEA